MQLFVTHFVSVFHTLCLSRFFFCGSATAGDLCSIELQYTFKGKSSSHQLQAGHADSYTCYKQMINAQT